MAGICHHIETKAVALRSTTEIHYGLFDLKEWFRNRVRYQVVILSSKSEIQALLEFVE